VAQISLVPGYRAEVVIASDRLERSNPLRSLEIASGAYTAPSQ
jgi:hypothetical protein